MRSPAAARLALAFLAAQALSVGIPASFAPRAFYDDFPFLASWVDLLGPFNEHLVTDVGGLQLGFALLFAWAAMRPSELLVRPLCAGWALAAALHLAFHARNLEPFGVTDAVGEIGALALALLLPGLALWAVGSGRRARAGA